MPASCPPAGRWGGRGHVRPREALGRTAGHVRLQVATTHRTPSEEQPPLSSSSQDVSPDPDLAAEQGCVTDLYRRLDAARELAVTRFRQALATPTHNPQAARRAGGRRRSSTASGSSRSTPPRAGCASAGWTAATPPSPATSAGSGCRPRTAPRSRCWSTGGPRPPSRSTPRPAARPRASAAAGTSAPAGGRSSAIADETLDLDDPRRRAAVRPGRRGGAAGRAERRAAPAG